MKNSPSDSLLTANWDPSSSIILWHFDLQIKPWILESIFIKESSTILVPFEIFFDWEGKHTKVSFNSNARKRLKLAEEYELNESILYALSFISILLLSCKLLICLQICFMSIFLKVRYKSGTVMHCKLTVK